MKSTILLIYLCFQFSIFSQSNSYNPDSTFALTALQQDFEILFNSVKSVHPALYDFTSQKQFSKLYVEYQSTIKDGLTHDEFHILIRQFIQHVKCGHTAALPSLEWYAYQRETSKVIPLEVYLMNENLYVKRSSVSDSILPVGSKILAINDRSPQKIIKDMREITPRDGLSMSFVNNKVEKLFRTYHLFLYGRKDNYLVTYINADGDKTLINLKRGDQLVKVERVTEKTDHVFELETSGATFQITSDNLTKYAYLDLNNFQKKGFKKFYKSVFEAIELNNIQNLILDLRSNGGGYFPNGNHLLEYLLDQDFDVNFSRSRKKIKSEFLYMDFGSKATRVLFNTMPYTKKTDQSVEHTIKYKPVKKHHFNGQVYVLINGGSFSMSGYVAAKLKHFKKAIFIGEETGGGEKGSNAILFYTLSLPNTKIRVKLPHYFLNHNVKTSEKGRGIMPDYPIVYSLKDRIEQQDLAIQKVLDLMK